MVRKLVAWAGAALALATPSIAHAEWHEASAPHFTIYSNEKPEKLREFASKLERFDKALRLVRGFEDPPIAKPNRLTIFVVGGTSDVARLAGDSDIAGFYRGRATGSIALVPRKSGTGDLNDLGPMQVLLHEYAHHFMWSTSPLSAYPLWLSEGWAEFHATAVFRKDGAIEFGHPPQYRAYSLLSGNWLSADKLLIADTLKLNDEQREGLYGRGWLLTHYLLSSRQRPGQIVDYMKAINNGQSTAEAAKVFGDLRVLDKELERYKTGKLNAYFVRGEALTIGDIAIRPLTPGEAATMPIRIRSQNGVTEKTAPGVYAAAKKACAPFPDDVGAQLVLAEAAYDAKDYAVAEAAADRALAVDPNAEGAHIYKAMVRMAVAIAAGDQSKESWRAIRKSITAANKLHHDDPEPLILYYRSFIEQGEEPPKVAFDGMLRAFELAPQDVGLRLTAAQLQMDQGNLAFAARILKPLAFDPHGEGFAEATSVLLKEIERRSAEAAQKTAGASTPAPAKPAASK